MLNNKFRLPKVKHLRKEVLFTMLILWAISSILAQIIGWDSVFPAIGSIALSAGLTIVLIHRYTSQEECRVRVNQEAIQKRMIWPHMKMAPNAAQEDDPLNLKQLGDRTAGGIENMVTSKRVVTGLRTYRYEMVYSVVRTPQRGLGGMLVDWKL